MPCLHNADQEAAIGETFEALVQQAAEEFPQAILPPAVGIGTCRNLRCGFVDICHPEAAPDSPADDFEDALRESADDSRT